MNNLAPFLAQGRNYLWAGNSLGGNFRNASFYMRRKFFAKRIPAFCKSVKILLK